MAPARPRHVPRRSCVSCRRKDTKRGLIRLVRTSAGRVAVDPSGRADGRGAYLCAATGCWDSALAGSALSGALRVSIAAEDLAKLEAFARAIHERHSDATSAADAGSSQ